MTSNAAVNNEEIDSLNLSEVIPTDNQNLNTEINYETTQIERIDIPDFGPETFGTAQKEYRVVDTKGEIPKYSTQAERSMAWKTPFNHDISR